MALVRKFLQLFGSILALRKAEFFLFFFFNPFVDSLASFCHFPCPLSLLTLPVTASKKNSFLWITLSFQLHIRLTFTTCLEIAGASLCRRSRGIWARHFGVVVSPTLSWRPHVQSVLSRKVSTVPDWFCNVKARRVGQEPVLIPLDDDTDCAAHQGCVHNGVASCHK